MKSCALFPFFIAILILNACGGGGSGGSNTSTVYTSSSSVMTSSSISSSTASSSLKGSASSNTSASSSTVEFFLDNTDVNFKTAITDTRPESIDILATLPNSKTAHFLINGIPPFIELSYQTTHDNDHVTLTFMPVEPKFLMPGKHSGKIYVRACKDERCVEEYSGSPKVIVASYEVIAPTFTISKRQVTFNITDTQTTFPRETITLTSSQQTLPGQFSLFTFYENFPAWLNYNYVWNGTDGTVELGVGHALLPGTYTAQLGASLFESQLSHRIDVTVNVASGSASSSSSSSFSSDCAGVIFDDSTCTKQWQRPLLFEQHKIDLVNMQVRDPDSGNLITVSTVDSGEVSHGQVLDISYNDAPFNGHVFFNTLAGYDGLDMTDYLHGKLIFDVKIISKGNANANLSIKVECRSPCESNLHELNVPTINSWTTIEIPIKDLVADGLDIERISNGFIILPEWQSQANSHFQVDNIRWMK